MRKYIVLCIFGFLSATGCIASESKSMPILLKNAQQLLLVLTPDWNAVQGTLRYYERTSITQPWSLVNDRPLSVVIGAKGMAWGQEWKNQSGQIKHEGDGRSPAGIYSLGTAFGISANPGKVIHQNWPYFPLTASSICVDDESSPYYNQLIDSATIKDWDSNTSGEHMLNIMPLYTRGIVIQYNKNNKKGAGSCIFMHVWRSPVKGTAGCVAMASEKLTGVLNWLNPAKMPVVILLPYSVYQQFQKSWDLPIFGHKIGQQ